MNRTVNLESILHSTVRGIIRWFAWIVFFLSLLFLAGSLLAKTFEVDLSLKNLSWFAVAASVLSVVNYFNFLASGKVKGRETEGYIKNYTAYKRSINGRRKKDIDDYLKEAKEQEKKNYIQDTCVMLGMTESEIMAIDTKKLIFNSQFTLEQKARIRNIHNKHFKSRLPKNSAQILNILARNPKGSHGLDINAPRRYVVRASLLKITTLVITALFGFSLILEVGIDNPFELAVKLIFVFISLCGSIGSGYTTGLKTTSEIEKDVLGATVRLLNDMDIWLREQGRKQKYSSEELVRTEETNNYTFTLTE